MDDFTVATSIFNTACARHLLFCALLFQSFENLYLAFWPTLCCCLFCFFLKLKVTYMVTISANSM